MILGLPAHTQGRLAHAAAAAGSGRFLLHARDHAPRARHWECSRTLWGVLGPAWERLLLVNPIVADSETGSGTGTCSVAAGTPFLCCGMCVCTIHGRRLGKLFLTSRCSGSGAGSTTSPSWRPRWSACTSLPSGATAASGRASTRCQHPRDSHPLRPRPQQVCAPWSGKRGIKIGRVGQRAGAGVGACKARTL